jgi:gluconokinase
MGFFRCRRLPPVCKRDQNGKRDSSRDADRAPWLEALPVLISSSLTANRPAVLACSALKERYRHRLLEGNDGVQIVYLKGSYDLIWSRMETRTEHYMKPQMLKSQFETLEEPTYAHTIDISISVDNIVQEILRGMEN